LKLPFAGCATGSGCSPASPGETLRCRMLPVPPAAALRVRGREGHDRQRIDLAAGLDLAPVRSRADRPRGAGSRRSLRRRRWRRARRPRARVPGRLRRAQPGGLPQYGHGLVAQCELVQRAPARLHGSGDRRAQAALQDADGAGPGVRSGAGLRIDVRPAEPGRLRVGSSPALHAAGARRLAHARVRARPHLGAGRRERGPARRSDQRVQPPRAGDGVHCQPHPDGGGPRGVDQHRQRLAARQRPIRRTPTAADRPDLLHRGRIPRGQPAGLQRRARGGPEWR
jgi:hypothetical protein